MGQQQLLLIILGAIIVAIAVVVGINMMGSASEQANLDAVRQDLLTIGSAAQGWYAKPNMMQGGGNSFTDADGNNISFADFTFPADTINPDADWAENSNGEYEVDAGNTNDSTFTVTATPAQNPGVTLTATITRGNISIAEN